LRAERATLGMHPIRPLNPDGVPPAFPDVRRNPFRVGIDFRGTPWVGLRGPQANRKRLANPI